MTLQTRLDSLKERHAALDARILDEDFRVSERIYGQGISLPSSYSLTPEDQDFVIGKMQDFYAHRN